MAVNEEVREFVKVYSIIRRDLKPFIDFLSVSVSDKERVSEMIR